MSLTGVNTTREQIRYSVENLRSLAPRRPPGHFEDFMAHAVMKSRDGKFIWLQREDAEMLSRKYAEFWHTEEALKAKKDKAPGPLWWRAYVGKRTIEEIKKDLANIFDFDVPPLTPLIKEFRDQVAVELAKHATCTPCQMSSIVNKATFAYIYRLNEHESNPAKPE